jgi:hypothetical protein
VINGPQLLSDLTRLLKRLEGDLLQRIEEVPELKTSLQAEWQAARDAERCAETFETWADQVITQAGVHWLLSCVFLRFIEDNQLVDRPWLGGTPESGRLALVRDRHEAYFQTHPLENDRDYLLAAFREAGVLPGLRTFFDERHNPVFRLGISGDAAMTLVSFWQQINPNSGALQHDFTDDSWSTRFLGDLYERLSEATRKRYALLQTPEFVEEFILDRTLAPAIQAFGFRVVRMIDPTCGSGHFLLGGFARLVAEWQRQEPGRNRGDVAQKALLAVAGVDLNPFAVAISRFRLLVAALQVAGVQRLANAPDLQIDVAIGDSLLHGTRFGLTDTQSLLGDQQFAGTGLAHAYASEDLADVQRILGRQYHAVVGNPPYIVVRDAALNAAYRAKFASCHRQYSLGCPFTERFFDLAITGDGTSSRLAGFVGLITANSFMKREFGSKLIEEVLPRLDLTHVIDTAGAHIPGHGTPTVILLGRHQLPVGSSLRAAMGIKGEPAKPTDPSQGLVWRAIVDQIDFPGSTSPFIGVVDVERASLGTHPWSLAGGGALELREQIESNPAKLRTVHADLGYLVITGEDNCLVVPSSSAKRLGIQHYAPIVEGDHVRDWQCHTDLAVLWPYEPNGADLPNEDAAKNLHFLWPFRTSLKDRKAFGVPVEQRGLRWWDLREVYKARLERPLTLAVSFVATHNHYFLDRGVRLFKQSAPVIKLPVGCDEHDYVGLLGLLNSSTACFWMKQVLHDKGNGGIGGGIASEDWERFYEFASTPMKEFPLPASRPLEKSLQMDHMARELSARLPATLFADGQLPDRSSLDDARGEAARLLHGLIAIQEELDWQCYSLYGLLPEGCSASDVEAVQLVELQLGERAFEIALARRVAAGDETTTWFERHGSTPITVLPDHWPAAYRATVERRIALIDSDRNLGLIECPEFKRRWNSAHWNDLEQAALRDWLLERLEAPSMWPASPNQAPQLNSTNRLADMVSRDAEFMQIAALYAGHTDFDLPPLVAELVAAEAVPALPIQRYTDTGLRKRAQWEDTWALQRREDAGEDVDKIPVPPKYQSKDFLKAEFWRLRGGLDVAKERWVSYPGCERGSDGSLVVAWAGWNHLQQATALAGYYMDMKDSEGWEPARLQPMLGSLLELVPRLEQWHNELDPVFGERMGDYYRGFVTEEARALGFTLDDLRAWKPAATTAKRGRKKKVAT